MKRITWKIEDSLELVYHTDSGEIFLEQDYRHPTGGRIEQVGIAKDEVTDLIVALGELRAEIDEDTVNKLESAA
jgi:hypothetical protein